MECLLCHSPKLEPLKVTQQQFGQSSYWHCRECDYRFLEPSQRLSREDEKIRYALHDSPIGDAKYFQYLEPLLTLVKKSLPQESINASNQVSRILDFGSGPNSVIQNHFQNQDCEISLYDSFFWPNENALQPHSFDVIVLSEVIEHLQNPDEELVRLKACLRPGGSLCISTQLYIEGRDFNSWGYRRDPTHIGFFSIKTFEWITHKYEFSSLELREPTGVRLSCHPYEK